MISAQRKVIGWGFISSMNEFIMCFQRAEMGAYGIADFNSISTQLKGRKFMTSNWMIGLELYFKMGIFWIFPLISLKECFRLDKVWYDYHMMFHPDLSFFNVFLSVCSSVVTMRSLIFRMFVIALYPSMGLRTLKDYKISQK